MLRRTAVVGAVVSNTALIVLGLAALVTNEILDHLRAADGPRVAVAPQAPRRAPVIKYAA